MVKLIVSFNALIFCFLTIFGSKQAPTPKSVAMPMCSNADTEGSNFWTNQAVAPVLASVNSTAVPFPIDSTKSYTMPLLAQTPKGEIIMSWTEKNEQGATAFCMAISKDNGKSFSDKKVIAADGVGNSRLFRAKVLAKKDGSFVAVFSQRIPSPAQAQAPTQAQTPPQGTPQGGRGGRGGGGRGTSALVYAVSKDAGTTWTTPQAVDSDPSAGMRGFFDAVVLSNDEIAVAYLKDVKGSTKHEERDLRLVLTKNGVFQPEKLLDAVVCDCCNINLLVDTEGAFHVYYRDNNDDIRDIARLTSKDNGSTFGKSEIVHNDGWKIAGCPHSGAISSTNGKSALIAWHSGSETESGVRLVTQEGKKLFVLAGTSAKNPALMTSPQHSVMLWEQAGEKPQLVFRKITGDKVSELLAIEGAENAMNATGLVVGNEILVAHEVKQGKNNGLRVATSKLKM